jgi:hypothetical protein
VVLKKEADAAPRIFGFHLMRDAEPGSRLAAIDLKPDT